MKAEEREGSLAPHPTGDVQWQYTSARREAVIAFADALTTDTTWEDFMQNWKGIGRRN
jgi:hypothetical protein